jgi:hypothetical protein
MIRNSAVNFLATTMLRGGIAVFATGLIAGLGRLIHYFYVTPFAVCSASLATMTVTDVWPWSVPWLALETAAVADIALALFVLADTPRSSAMEIIRAQGGNEP